MEEARTGPRTLRRVVFGYTVDCFPSQLILAHNQLKRMLERAGYNVAVSMCPLDDLPTDSDILFVPTQLADHARRLALNCQVQVCEDFVNQPMYDDLIKQLGEGKKWTAPFLARDLHEDASGQIMRYRGYERIE